MAKPIFPKVLLARVRSILKVEEAKEIIHSHEQWLEKEVEMKTYELAALQKLTIFAMTSLCSEWDQETVSHIVRTQIYVRILAEEIKYHPELTEKYSHFHDIGKVGIPDRILFGRA